MNVDGCWVLVLTAVHSNIWLVTVMMSWVKFPMHIHLSPLWVSEKRICILLKSAIWANLWSWATGLFSIGFVQVWNFKQKQRSWILRVEVDSWTEAHWEKLKDGSFKTCLAWRGSSEVFIHKNSFSCPLSMCFCVCTCMCPTANRAQSSAASSSQTGDALGKALASVSARAHKHLLGVSPL